MIDPKKRDLQRFKHIIKACNRIDSYLKGLSKEEFLSDVKVQDAVIYQLIIIGEAVANINRELLGKYPYTWYKIKAFRNYATHEYFNIHVWTVWDIVDIHLKEMKKIVEVILEDEFHE